MRAFYARSYGGPEVMALGELPDPVPGRGELLVAIKAASVNPVDWKVRRGDLRIISGSTFPKILGSDFAGIVEALGPGTAGFAVGDRVYGATAIMLRRPGTHAALLAIAARRVRRVPEALSLELAAAMPIAGLTALSGLRKCGELAGRSVVVNGATGGVGHFAVQIATARGAEVTAVCSARNADFARSLGASTVIDYAVEDFTASSKRHHVIFDAHAGIGPLKAARALEPGGVYATTLPRASLVLGVPLLALQGRKRVVNASLRDRPEDYAELERLVLSGAVKPTIDRTFPLERAADAFDASERGGVRGKVVIEIDPAAARSR